jgi:YD repeat-containing protein
MQIWMVYAEPANSGYLPYDAYGNLTSDGTYTQHDAADRLTALEVSGQVAVTATYNGDGDLVAIMVGGEATTYVRDWRTLGSVVLVEVQSTGVTRNLYGRNGRTATTSDVPRSECDSSVRQLANGKAR